MPTRFPSLRPRATRPGAAELKNVSSLTTALRSMLFFAERIFSRRPLRLALFEPVRSFPGDPVALFHDYREIVPVVRGVRKPDSAVSRVAVIVFVQAEVPPKANLLHRCLALHEVVRFHRRAPFEEFAL